MNQNFNNQTNNQQYAMMQHLLRQQGHQNWKQTYPEQMRKDLVLQMYNSLLASMTEVQKNNISLDSIAQKIKTFEAQQFQESTTMEMYLQKMNDQMNSFKQKAQQQQLAHQQAQMMGNAQRLGNMSTMQHSMPMNGINPMVNVQFTPEQQKQFLVLQQMNPQAINQLRNQQQNFGTRNMTNTPGAMPNVNNPVVIQPMPIQPSPIAPQITGIPPSVNLVNISTKLRNQPGIDPKILADLLQIEQLTLKQPISLFTPDKLPQQAQFQVRSLCQKMQLLFVDIDWLIYNMHTLATDEETKFSVSKMFMLKRLYQTQVELLKNPQNTFYYINPSFCNNAIERVQSIKKLLDQKISTARGSSMKANTPPVTGKALTPEAATTQTVQSASFADDKLLQSKAEAILSRDFDDSSHTTSFISYGGLLTPPTPSKKCKADRNTNKDAETLFGVGELIPAIDAKSVTVSHRDRVYARMLGSKSISPSLGGGIEEELTLLSARYSFDFTVERVNDFWSVVVFDDSKFIAMSITDAGNTIDHVKGLEHRQMSRLNEISKKEPMKEIIEFLWKN